MRIDAHHHFWRIERGDYGWLSPASRPIYRDFLPRDLAPTLRQHGIGQTILVQAAPSEDETHFLLDIAARTPFVAGVVGWVDFEADDVTQRIASLASSPWLKGLRPMIQDIADPRWMLNRGLTSGFNAMADHGLTFDALVKPEHLLPLCEFLTHYPSLRVVVDHGAKPNIKGGAFREWADAMRSIAAGSGAFCKLSGLATEASPGWSDAVLAPYMDLLLDAFGAERLMWGSDWPVLMINGDYDRWVGCVENWSAALPNADRAAIWGETAARFYGL
jgi:L-fuconolactonase